MLLNRVSGVFSSGVIYTCVKYRYILNDLQQGRSEICCEFDILIDEEFVC